MTVAALSVYIAVAVASGPADPLPSWRDSVAKQRIFDFVANVTQPGPHYVAPEDRIVVFHDDGTLWAESSMPLADALAEDPIRHPITRRRYSDLVYTPMSEMLAFLQANGFTTYIVAGSDVDAIRPWASRAFDLSPDLIVRSRASVEGRPIMAFVSSDSELSLLARATAGAGARLGVVVDHADDSGGGAQTMHLREDAPARGWLVVDVPRDWRQVHPSRPWPEH